MTLDERIADANARSVSLYLSRQTLQVQLQQLQLRGQQIDLELIKIDGKIEVLEQMKAEEKKDV